MHFLNSSGIIRTGQDFLIGPLSDGTFFPCKVSTIQRYRVPRQRVRAGQAATLNLPQIQESQLRKVRMYFWRFSKTYWLSLFFFCWIREWFWFPLIQIQKHVQNSLHKFIYQCITRQHRYAKVLKWQFILLIFVKRYWSLTWTK